MPKITRIFTLLIISSLFLSCGKGNNIDKKGDNEIIIVEELPNNYSTNQHYILKNGSPLIIKGVGYVPVYPGYLPWEIETSTSLPNNLKESINRDISNIKAMGANTLRLWGVPKHCYTTIKNIGGLEILQTIWINGEVSDFHDAYFKETTKEYIRVIIDRIYSVFSDNDPPLLAILIGNELSHASILSTNAAHPEINAFNGNFISTQNSVNATEAFIAEMADYVKTYEYATYQNNSLVSYAHEIRTYDLLDTPFLDFRCQNAYSYSTPQYRPNTAIGSSSGTLFQGWIEEIKSKFPEIPLLITETGLSISPNASHIGPPNYGYGGNTLSEQANGIQQCIEDINTAELPIAGIFIHEYLDSWWKFGLEDSYSQDPNDVEEWFGLTRFKTSGTWYTTEFRPVYHRIKGMWVD